MFVFESFFLVFEQKKTQSHLKVRRRSQIETQCYKNINSGLFEKINESVNKVEHFLQLRFKNQSNVNTFQKVMKILSFIYCPYHKFRIVCQIKLIWHCLSLLTSF
jgi:hypothetical protein